MTLLHRGLAALCALLAICTAEAALAQTMTYGQDVGGVRRPIRTDTAGRLVGSSAAVQLAPSLTVDNSAYTAGDALTDLITVTGAAGVAGGSGTVVAVDIASAGGSTNSVHVYAWSKQPAATCTKNAAFAPSASDNAYRLPGFPMQGTLAGNGLSVDTRTRIQLNGFAAPFKNQDTTPGTAIYLCLVTGGSVTPASTSDLSIVVGELQD